MAYTGFSFGNGGGGGSFTNPPGLQDLRARAKTLAAGSQQPDPLGISGALNPPPQVQNFYQALLGQQLRGIADQTAAARSNALENLSARGLGQSSLVGRTLSSIGRGQQTAAQAATTNVQSLQFQQLLAALDYERQRQMLRLGHQLGSNPFLNALNSLGSAAAFIFSPGSNPSMSAGTNPTIDLNSG